MAIKIAIANQKGGIGKTTTALALASKLIEKGYRTLLIDTDPQQNSTHVYGAQIDGVATLFDIFNGGFEAKDCIQHTEMGDIIASDEALNNADAKFINGPRTYRYIKKALKSVEDDYDFIIFDTPPQIGILLGNVLTATQYVICPIICDKFGVQGLSQFSETIDIYKEDNEDLKFLGVLRVKFKGNLNLTKGVNDGLPDYIAGTEAIVFDTTIRESVKCQEAQMLGQPLYKYAPNCTTAEDYSMFVDELLKVLGISEIKETETTDITEE